MEIDPSTAPTTLDAGAMDIDGSQHRRGRSRFRWGAIPTKETQPPPPNPDGTAETNEEAGNTTTAPAPAPKRRRKSRWEDPNPVDTPTAGPNEDRALMLMPSEIVLSNGIKVLMPSVLTGRGDPELVALHKKLVDVERKIKSGVVEIPPEGRRSPSPPPVYDSQGVRLNTREVRYREKLGKERNATIEELIKKDPSYKPPTDYRPEKKWKKISIPEKDYPGYNFIGLIIGPRGNTQKRMQSETNTKIAIRGKGSIKEGVHKNDKYDYGEDEELHVFISGDRQEDIDAAAAMVEKLLQPMDEEMNEHKQKQLRELAALNGTLKEENYCFICGEQGHSQLNCPKKAVDVYRLPDALALKVEEQYNRDVARMNPGQSVHEADNEYKSFLAELGGTDPRATSAGGAGAGGGRFGDANEKAMLWVGNIPPSINDIALKQLFDPYGQVTLATVKVDNGVSRGFGFIHFAEEAQAKAAVEGLTGRFIDGKSLIVRLKGEPREPRAPRSGLGHFAPRPEDELPPECKLYIGCLPPHVDDFTLRREFEHFGTIAYTRVIVDRETQRPKGFGFVAFTDANAAATAITAMNQWPGWDASKPLVVKVAGDAGRGGFGGGRGGGRGGGPGGFMGGRGGGGFGYGYHQSGGYQQGRGGGPPPPGGPCGGGYDYGHHPHHQGGYDYGAVPPPLPPGDPYGTGGGGGYGAAPLPAEAYPGYDQGAYGAVGGSGMYDGGYGAPPPLPPGPPGPGGGYDKYDPYGGHYGSAAPAAPAGYDHTQYAATYAVGAPPPPPAGAEEGEFPPGAPPPPQGGGDLAPPPPPPGSDPSSALPPPPPPVDINTGTAAGAAPLPPSIDHQQQYGAPGYDAAGQYQQYYGQQQGYYAGISAAGAPPAPHDGFTAPGAPAGAGGEKGAAAPAAPAVPVVDEEYEKFMREMGK